MRRALVLEKLRRICLLAGNSSKCTAWISSSGGILQPQTARTQNAFDVDRKRENDGLDM